MYYQIILNSWTINNNIIKINKISKKITVIVEMKTENDKKIIERDEMTHFY